MNQWNREYPQDVAICIVSHGGMINMNFRSLLNLPMMTEQSISCGDTSIHKFMLSEGKCHIEYVNRLGHLGELE